jgi:hypothetical protein
MTHEAQTIENIKADIDLLTKEIEELDDLRKQKKDKVKRLSRAMGILEGKNNPPDAE